MYTVHKAAIWRRGVAGDYCGDTGIGIDVEASRATVEDYRKVA
jgi:hypothetical protein